MLLNKKFALSIIIFVLILNCSSLTYGINIKKDTNSDFEKNIIYVGGNYEGSYSSIQQAIDASNDGDTIFVFEDIYYENIVIDKSIELIGEDRYNTIIHGGLSEPAVLIIKPSAVVKGFNVRNGNWGIEIRSDKNKIQENVISNNVWRGIYLVRSDNNEISYNEIKNNMFYGIYLVESHNNYVFENTIIYNQIGASFYLSNNNEIKYNNASENYIAGIEIHNSDINIFSGNIISKNEQSGVEIISDDNKNSDKNLFFKNNFSKNLLFNAYDNGENIWFNSNIKKGNHWDDYDNSLYYNVPPYKTKNIDKYPLNRVGDEKIKKVDTKYFSKGVSRHILKLLFFTKLIFNT